MNFSLRSKLVTFFLASSLLAVAAISAYLLTFYDADRRTTLRKLEVSAFRQRVENLESLIQSAQAASVHPQGDDRLLGSVIFVAEGACDPHVPPKFSIPRKNRAHLTMLGLTPSMWTNGLTFFLACKRIADARNAGKPIPSIQLLPSKIDLAVPYLALMFADASGTRLTLVSMDEALNPPGARVFVSGLGSPDEAPAASPVIWSADPAADLEASFAEAGMAQDRLQRTLASSTPVDLVDLKSDTVLSSAPVLGRWRLFSLTHLPMISASVAFALRQIVFLAVGMLSLNALVGFRFANLFVRPLEELRTSTEKIGAGQLDFRFEISGRNEIESLKRSFNTMTEKISGLIEDNRRKAEVDSELKLAREVGSMLFPRDHVQLPGLEITARMNRSDQFSGEWWGYADLSPPGGAPGKRVLLVADLQKSGTQGALAIAALRGSAAAVEAWALAKPELAADPCAVLKTLTEALSAAGRGKFLPILFAAVFDPVDHQLRCARTGPTGGVWIGPGGSQVQSVSASEEAYQAFPWEPGAKLLTFTPRLTALQPGGAIFSTEALDRAVATASSLGASSMLGKIAQARASVIKGANYTMIACEATAPTEGPAHA